MQALAEHGEVEITGHEIAKLIGKVFLQKSAVNLLVGRAREAGEAGAGYCAQHWNSCH